MSRDAAAIAAVESIVQGAEEADEILRATVDLLAEQYDAGVGIRFVEEGTFTDGPWAGQQARLLDVIPITYNGDIVAELVVTTTLDAEARLAWERIVDLINPYCLVGWDIGGEHWEP